MPLAKPVNECTNVCCVLPTFSSAWYSEWTVLPTIRPKQSCGSLWQCVSPTFINSSLRPSVTSPFWILISPVNALLSALRTNSPAPSFTMTPVPARESIAPSLLVLPITSVLSAAMLNSATLWPIYIKPPAAAVAEWSYPEALLFSSIITPLFWS